jgi:methionyl-tRNA formyltransferase
MSARIVFVGSPTFALPTLRALAAGYPVVGVVTRPDRPAGRGRVLSPPPVKTLALELGLPLMQPSNLRQPEAVAQLLAWQPELIVVAAFGQILRAEVLDLPQFGCLNVHASLLPRWRGAAPIQAALLAGDLETGVTVMKMDQGLDTGAIVSQRAIAVAPADTAGLLTDCLADVGAELLVETLPGYLAGTVMPQAQPEQGVTYAPALKKDYGLLDLTRPAEEAERRVRASNPWPGAYISLGDSDLRILRAHTVVGTAPVGARALYEGQPALGTSSGLLVLDEVQPPGKRAMTGTSYLAGRPHWHEQALS